VDTKSSQMFAANKAISDVEVEQVLFITDIWNTVVENWQHI
jgi:hypothetical protein